VNGTTERVQLGTSVTGASSPIAVLDSGVSVILTTSGLAHMISESTMRPDIDHADEYLSNTTARAFSKSVVASALGIPSILPFLKAVCRSKKSWQARHTGIRIQVVQQIAIMMGSASSSKIGGLHSPVVRH
jgi:hypothetical protein